MAPLEHENSKPFDESEESSFLEQRDAVSDEELVARMLSAPDCGGGLWFELSEFVTRRNTSGVR